MNMKPETYQKLREILSEALEYYSNVHRGSGQNSEITTRTYEKCRGDILEYFGLGPDKYVVIFCSPAALSGLRKKLKEGSYQVVTSHEKGLQLGVVAIAVDKRKLPKGIPAYAGGGTARLVSPGWVIWEKAPDRFEAGTPAVINILAFVTILKLSGSISFEKDQKSGREPLSAEEILNLNEFDNMSGKKVLKIIEDGIFGRSRSEHSIPDRFINLDYAASTPAFRQTFETYVKAFNADIIESEKILAMTRSVLADFFGAPSDKYDVIFTSNTTEAINIVADSESCLNNGRSGSIVINTILEHNSNELPWRSAI
jgi:selenocysteine lyase/cysteine desulfurase